MKKIIAIILLAVMVISLASCSPINDKAVAILWNNINDDYLFTIADALDRGFYIENIDHVDYDAEGNAEKQIEQAKEAIASGTPALVVNAVNDYAAKAVFDLAKNANIPVIFLCNNTIDKATLTLFSSYEKCVVVDVDESTKYEIMGKKIAYDVIDNMASNRKKPEKDVDRNDDGKITYTTFGLSLVEMEIVEKSFNEYLAAYNAKCEEKDKEKKKIAVELVRDEIPMHTTLDVTSSINLIFANYDGSGDSVNETPVELIITNDDAYVAEMVIALRNFELNYKKLVTHSIPLYTVGITTNAADILVDDVVRGDRDDWPRDNEEQINDEKAEKDAYSVMSMIDDGYVTGAALEDDDEIALSVALILRNYIKGDSVFEDVNADYVSGNNVLVPYTVYSTTDLSTSAIKPK